MSESTSAPTRIPQNIPSRESARALLALRIPRILDIARLRPSGLPRGKRFETVDDARARRDAELERFEEIPGLAHAADRLLWCSARSPCAEVYCAVCGRQFRRWLTGQALRHQSGLDLQVVTVALELAPTNRLTDCDLPLVKRRAAQRVRRAAPSAEFVLGGIEAEYRHGSDSFLIHAHLLVSQLPPDQLKALRSAFADIDVMKAVKVQELRDPPAQISYLLKFPTFHRPAPQNGPRRPRAIPLPDDALEALTLWRARHGFMDFVFMMGLRRSGGDLVRIDKQKT